MSLSRRVLTARPSRGRDLSEVRIFQEHQQGTEKLGRKRKNERPLQSPVLINTKSWLPTLDNLRNFFCKPLFVKPDELEVLFGSQ